MVIVFGYVARTHSYPDALGYNKQFQSIVRNWRIDPNRYDASFAQDEQAFQTEEIYRAPTETA